MDLAHAPIQSPSKSEIAAHLLFIGLRMCQYAMQGTVASKVMLCFPIYVFHFVQPCALQGGGGKDFQEIVQKQRSFQLPNYKCSNISFCLLANFCLQHLPLKA